MTLRFTPQLAREVFLRTDSIDEQTWYDTFEIGYHVPPNINPPYVLDLGANIGLTAAHYRSMWPDAEIMAVEMDKANARICARNFRGLVITVAVGAVAGEGTYTTSGFPDAYALSVDGDRPTQIMTVSQLLDDWLPDADRVFCKMDIEGAEWDILARGIDRRIKWLLVELHSEESSEEKIDRGMSFLLEDGFAVAQHLIHPSALWGVR